MKYPCEHCGEIHEEHHIWCNYWTRPRWHCKMCKGLYVSYPLCQGKTVEDIMKEHFPDVIIRTGTGDKNYEKE